MSFAVVRKSLESRIRKQPHLTNNFILKMKNDCYNNSDISSYYIIGVNGKSYNHVYLRVTRSSHAEGQR